MLVISVKNERQNQRLEHADGPIEFGRGPERDVARLIIEDIYVSRNHLRAEELADSRIRLDNLSNKNVITLADGKTIAVGGHCEVYSPVRLTLGDTLIEIIQEDGELLDRTSLRSIAPPRRPAGSDAGPRDLVDLSQSPVSEILTSWLETVIAMQRAPADSPEFYNQVVTALVDLVGLDLGLVLLRRDQGWITQAIRAIDKTCPTRPSRTLLEQVVAEGRTFYQDVTSMGPHLSLEHVKAAIVSPIFGMHDEVIGALYGVQSKRSLARALHIGLLEAQLVQLLAAAVGATLTRAGAARTRVQFEQFFSPELVRELERDSQLLEGRNREVTILVSDLRGFTHLSERLGPEITCRLIRDMMEQLSERIASFSGVIVDYAGDGILAMWNAPVDQEDHAVRACRAALAMLAELPGLNAKWEKVVGGPLKLGIGLNTGPAQVGNTGSSRKFKYGPHGFTVNLASRVQGMTKKVGTSLLITESTRKLLPDSFIANPTSPVDVEGVPQKLVLYELHGEVAAFE